VGCVAVRGNESQRSSSTGNRGGIEKKGRAETIPLLKRDPEETNHKGAKGGKEKKGKGTQRGGKKEPKWGKPSIKQWKNNFDGRIWGGKEKEHRPRKKGSCCCEKKKRPGDGKNGSNAVRPEKIGTGVKRKAEKNNCYERCREKRKGKSRQKKVSERGTEGKKQRQEKSEREKGVKKLTG